MSRKLSSNMENYLETISWLEEKHGHAHIKDIAKQIGVSMPSVSEALAKLKRSKFVVYKRYGPVILTQKGKTVAKEVFRRHRIIFEFLSNILRVNKEIAEEDACKIEHVINSETFKKLVKFVDAYKK